jgi:signal transduction histidine kinase/CheY-like chemotaxis protein
MAKILIVEDHGMSRQVLHTLLGYLGHRVLEAAVGTEALDIAQTEYPDLIISDILLPVMDGLEFVRQLRNNGALHSTPVIFYTARCRHTEDICPDSALGPYRIIPKPSEPELIIRTVNELLGITSIGDNTQANAVVSAPGRSKHGFSDSAELQLSVLMDLGYSMVAERNPKQLLSTFSRAMCEMLNCRQSLLAVKEEKGAICYYSGQVQSLPMYSCPDHMLPPEDILRSVISERRPVIFSQPQGWGMAVPFVSPERDYGWICLSEKLDSVPFSERDEEIAVALSAQAALAYENILLVEQLQASNETKGMFITNMSHEFRTPLNILLSNAQLIKLHLQGDEMPDKGRLMEKIDMQIRNCNRLLRLVNNFIDITKIDANFFELKPVRCNIVEIVEAITMSVVDYAGTKGIDLVFDTEEEEIILICDLDCIERIILNLLSNAIKFTPKGGTIYVNIIKGKGCVRISVRDTGIGISEDKLEVIFERFRQVDNLMTRKNEGSGIGLTLVKLLTEMHGGRVYVYSRYHEGSEFVIELPINNNGIETNCTCEHVTNSSKDDIIQRIQMEFSDIYF